MKPQIIRALIVCLLALPCAVAQNVTSTLVGTVQDSSGAFIPGATLTAVNEGTNIETKAKTDASGSYVIPGLRFGQYTLRTDAAGFKPNAIKGITLLPNRTTRQEVSLEVGNVQQAIEVTADVAALNTESATIGSIMPSQQITTVPLNGRFLDRLIRISAGVTTDSASNPRVAGSSYWGGMAFNVDGAAFNDPGNGGGAYSYRHGMSTLPSVDAVSEFKIDSNSQKAEFEGAVSATIATKSGTNQLHGTLFYFNRNKAYAATNFFRAVSPVTRTRINPPFNRNEYGFMAGGPIVKNRTFIFGGYEALKERAPRANTLSVPTAPMRAGNYAGFPTIIDPLSGTAFPNNQIPSTRIDSRTQTLLQRVPLPNQAGTGVGGTVNNYAVNIRNDSDINRYFVRLDHRFGEKDTVWFTGSISKADPYFVAQAFPQGYGSWDNGGNDTRIGNFTWNHTFSPGMLNEARAGYTYHGPVRQGMNRDFDPRTIFPDLYGPLPVGGLPQINVSGFVSIGD